jgi:hypothetical protein
LVDLYIDDGDIREFSVQVLSSELVWHRDLENRILTVLEGIGWQLQYDNGLPFNLNLNDKIFISSMQYHRVIKGSTNLKLKIERKQ